MNAYVPSVGRAPVAPRAIETTSVKRAARQAFGVAGLMLSVRRERAQLAEASPETLADLGLTRKEADKEAARPFWDLPKR